MHIMTIYRVFSDPVTYCVYAETTYVFNFTGCNGNMKQPQLTPPYLYSQIDLLLCHHYKEGVAVHAKKKLPQWL